MSIPLSLLGNGSMKTLPLRRIHTQKQKNWWTHRLLCGSCHIYGKQAISSSQNFLFSLQILPFLWNETHYNISYWARSSRISEDTQQLSELKIVEPYDCFSRLSAKISEQNPMNTALCINDEKTWTQIWKITEASDYLYCCLPRYDST
jgi:hypothetical protein